ncbi:MAG TPA: hypothetical protein VMG08_02515 [Allosphingosinicella sp.]|nr:hypothetical protein [Allosphingosinicella sp.]
MSAVAVPATGLIVGLRRTRRAAWLAVVLCQSLQIGEELLQPVSGGATIARLG